MHNLSKKNCITLDFDYLMTGVLLSGNNKLFHQISIVKGCK